MDKNDIEVSVVMPCLNEALTLEVCIRKAMIFFKDHQINGEVVIADNGSTDGSQNIAVQCGARVVNVAEKGYGGALRGGISEAYGKYVIMGDSDDSYDFTNLMPFVVQLRAGNDLVMGNRFMGGIGKGAMPFLHYWLGNPVLSFLGRLFFKSKIGDFHCGLRGFSKSAFLRMGLITTGMEFASEMIIKATLNKMKIAEVPTTLKKDGRDRPPHLRTWRDGWRHLRFMLVYSPAWLFLYPGIFLTVVGLILTLLLLNGPIGLGGVYFDITTLVYSGITFFIGIQFVKFYFNAKIFAIQSGLMPKNEKFDAIFKYINLENGLIAGILLLLGGIIGSFYALKVWNSHTYGELNPQQIFRIVIPSILLIVLGIEVCLSSFFFSMLGMKTSAKNQ